MLANIGKIWSLILLCVTLSASAETCTPDCLTLCLVNGRYKVTSYWQNQYANGIISSLNAKKVTETTGAFWIFSDLIEYAVRITPGDNNKNWVSICTLTDVEFWMTITDIQNGQTKTYHSPAGNRTMLYDPYFFDL